jgi:Ca2+-binding EF-hand superfamily protein
MINNGYYSKNNIKKWFEIIDTNETGIITTEQLERMKIV